MAVTTTPHTLAVDDAHSGHRLDHFLREWLPQLSRVALRELFERGGVRVNGRPANKGSRLTAGDRVELVAAVIPEWPGPGPDHELPLRVLYEDEALIVVDKQAGVPSHALRAGELGTIVSALIARYPELERVGYRALEPGLLHRLDNDTSGVLIAARTQAAFETLRAAQQRGELRKRYVALVSGVPSLGVEQAFLRAADRRDVVVRQDPFPNAKAITTELVSTELHGAYSLVCIQVSSAARHQVRAHLAQLGHPIAGDRQYGGPPLEQLERHFLHASELTLPHPHDGRPVTFRAALPPELRKVLEHLGT